VYDGSTFMSRERLIATPSQTVGPFFHFGLVREGARGTMAGPATPGERITLRLHVTDGNGAPVPDAMIELWQADAEGRYVRPGDPSLPAETDASPGVGDFRGFGRLPTAQDGTCSFETIRPGLVSDSSGRFQAAHINVCFFSRGLSRHLFTRIYFAGDERLDDDVVLAHVPTDRRPTLLASPVAGSPGVWSFAIRLQGDNETVFFDL
jgi:protocatechuate 3,4-dioxygenase alpha subunit